jgi:hypothetical protein
MYPLRNPAEQVSSWTSLGIKLPKDLAQAVATYEAVRWTETEYPATFDVEAVTAENAEAQIRALAEQLTLSRGTEQGGSGLSVLGIAKQQILSGVSRQVLALARAALPEAIRQLSKPFDAAAKSYVEAVNQLPAEITAESLLNAGAEVVAAYGKAQEHAGYLGTIDAWVSSTGHLTGGVGRDMEVTLRILRPEHQGQVIELDEAHRINANQALSSLNPVWYTAAKLGVEFGINTLREADQLRRDLASRQKLVSS